MSALAAIRNQVISAVHACEEKKAQEVAILELEKGSGAFTDYFVICSGANPRQIQTIADSVEDRLNRSGVRATHTEGYNQAEWVLLDYVDFVVHIFSENARKFYDLERLWRSARRVAPADLERKRATPKRETSRNGTRPGRRTSSARRKKSKS